MPRHELVPFLQQLLLEQKKVDASISGVPAVAESLPVTNGTKEPAGRSDVQLILPSDTKKRAKHTKQMFLDRGVFGATVFDGHSNVWCRS